MPDFDVAAKSLAVPPRPAPVASYFPAVAVENLGIEPATVAGTLRIYDRAAGTLIATHSLAPTTIAIGATENVASSSPWQPVAGDIGKHFLFTATITYAKDQYLANNNLSPTDVMVTAEPPPPPPPVAAHASQHEDGGADELNVDDLPGHLAEDQTPEAHASQHEAGHDDEISVDGLSGVLVDPQDPKAHASTHEPGGADPITGIPAAAHKTSHQNNGTDEISVAGLSGELADAQTPKAHQSSHGSTASDEIPLLSALLLNSSQSHSQIIGTGGGEVQLESLNPCTASTPAYASLAAIWQGEAFIEVEGTAEIDLIIELDGNPIGGCHFNLTKTGDLEMYLPWCIIANATPLTAGAHTLELLAYNTGDAIATVNTGKTLVWGIQ